jgi:hypothetical protein
VVKYWHAWQKATADATTSQRKAGTELATVRANSHTFFRADDDTELTRPAQGKAFAAWYAELGMSAQFVSNALARAEMARLVPDVEATLNTDHIKRLAPVLSGKKGQTLTDSQKRKAIESTIKKATTLAKKAGRVTITGGDIQKARNVQGRNADVHKDVSIADVAALTDHAVCATGDTPDDIATIAAWLEGATIAMATRDAAAEQSDADADAAQAA